MTLLCRSVTATLLLALLASSPTTWASDHYVVDPSHTFSSFEYSHWGLSAQRGRFDRSSGYIDLDRDSQTGAILLEIDAGSVSTGTEMFDRIMRSESFFDVDHFQKIVFSSTRLVFDQDQLTHVEGNLTIKDTTRQVTLDISHFNCRFMVLYLKQTCGANGSTKILRSDYKMGRYAPFVSNEVTLYFSVEAIKE